MPPRSRYKGESNCYDIANHKVYLGDMIYSWGRGDDLTGWTVVGATISSDGQMNLYDATPGGGAAQAYITLPNSAGEFRATVSCKFTRQSDDNSASVAFASHLCPVTTSVVNGMGWYTSNAASFLAWRNMNYGGSLNGFTVPFAPQVSVEYQFDIIMTDKMILLLINNILMASISVSTIGSAPLSSTPASDFRTANKVFILYTAHGAGLISHYRVREIRVSRLVGVSSM
jgi:hypothetical protein